MNNELFFFTNLDNMIYTFSLCFHPAIYGKFKSCYPSVKERKKKENEKRKRPETKDYVAVM